MWNNTQSLNAKTANSAPSLEVAGLETEPSGRELQFWGLALALTLALALAATWSLTHDMAVIAFVRPAIASALRWRSMAPYAGFPIRSTVFLACVVHDSQKDDGRTWA
jgi:hypothetical protein